MMAMVSAAPEAACLAGSTEQWAVVVKNTFITVEGEDDETVSGRPSSLPPSFRLSHRCLVDEPPSPVGSCQRGLRAGRRARSNTKAVGEEDASTEAGSLPAEEDASTEAGTTEGEEPSPEAMLDIEPLGASNSVVSEGAAKPATLLSQVVASAASRGAAGARRLNSSAQAWTPSAALSAAPSEHGRRFHLQLERIIQAARSILLGCACVACVEPSRAACGWTLAVHVRKEQFHCKELVLTQAKEALLMAAEASESVYVLGYLARPFVASLVGFSARLAAVQDGHQACWGLLKNGFCHYGNKCRWQHPECQATVSVLALLAAEAA